MNCSGLHRSLGVHISKVRSVALDKWEPSFVQNMAAIGNTKSNAYFEAALPPQERIAEFTDAKRREEFIRAKYCVLYRFR